MTLSNFSAQATLFMPSFLRKTGLGFLVRIGSVVRHGPVFLAGFGLSMGLHAQTKELQFDAVFTTKGEPAYLHYTVETESPQPHHMEVWRSGQLKIKRSSDALIETYAVKKKEGAEFYMSVLDLKRKIHTQIDRTNLIRIGNFTDWFDLGHGLKHPLGDYQLKRHASPEPSTAKPSPCVWYTLTQKGVASHICWSTQARLPILIENDQGQVQWRVLAWDNHKMSDDVFIIHDQGFVKNNANEDIEKD